MIKGWWNTGAEVALIGCTDAVVAPAALIGIELSVVWSIVLHSLLKQLLSKHKERPVRYPKVDPSGD